MKEHMRGNLLDSGVNFVFALLFIGILLGAGAIALGALTPAAPASGSALQNTSWMTMATTIGNGSVGVGNFSAQLPTVGTLAGVGLIILVLFVAIGAYVMGKRE